MTLRHMKIFLAVFRTKNITRAAEMLCMTQPAVTRAIKELERYYGVQLFDRINRRLFITESGKLLYSYSLHILDSFEQLEHGLRNWENVGVLRIGTTLTIGNLLLPSVLCTFQKKYPQVKVKADVATGAQLRKALLSNQLDFAVIEGAVYDSELLTKELPQDRLVLVLAPDDPRSCEKDLCLQDFAQDPQILRNEGSISRSLIDHVFAMHGIPVEPVIESISTQAVIRAVSAGLGISFLPEQLVSPAIESGMVSTAELSDETFVRQNYLVWHKQKFLTESAKVLMQCFIDSAEQQYS